MRPVSILLPTTLALASSLLACASMRQNLRGQELSYRGAWHCKGGACEAGSMVKSTAGSRDGTVMINEVELAPKAGLAFTAASPFETLTATVVDCKGTRSEVPSAAIVAPGKHGIGNADAAESWVVWIDPADHGGLERGTGKCAVWYVDAAAGWSDGASYSLRAGIRAAP